MSGTFVDTSVSVPMVLLSHTAHAAVDRFIDDRAVQMAAHTHLESYSVLTRLPGDSRLRPNDAARLIRERFGEPVPLSAERSCVLVDELAELGIAGGSVYDALIAATAAAVGATLLTRDRRAAATYGAMRVAYEFVGD